MNFTAGADPEIFVGDAQGVRSIIGKIGGSKTSPQPLPTLGDGFGVQEDNVAMEFTIPPSGSRAAFVDNIGKTVAFLESVVNDMYGYKLVKESAVSFPEAELNHPMAMVFGCEPDYNAWTGRVNRKPRADDPNLRSAGGHVHIGIPGRLSLKQKRSIIQRCDLYMGIPSILMDKGDLRKQLYGKAGAFRPKPYGVEYRTLSNFWVFDTKLTGWVYDQVARVLMHGEDTLDGKEIQACINGNDKQLASALVDRHHLEVL
jgi:hypothetical protein